MSKRKNNDLKWLVFIVVLIIIAAYFYRSGLLSIGVTSGYTNTSITQFPNQTLLISSIFSSEANLPLSNLSVLYYNGNTSGNFTKLAASCSSNLFNVSCTVPASELKNGTYTFELYANENSSSPYFPAITNIPPNGSSNYTDKIFMASYAEILNNYIDAHKIVNTSMFISKGYMNNLSQGLVLNSPNSTSYSFLPTQNSSGDILSVELVYYTGCSNGLCKNSFNFLPSQFIPYVPFKSNSYPKSVAVTFSGVSTSSTSSTSTSSTSTSSSSTSLNTTSTIGSTTAPTINQSNIISSFASFFSNILTQFANFLSSL